MYKQFFGLREDPFTMAPDPRFLYLTPQHREALAGITYAILNARRLVLLSGDIGTGKTTLLETVVRYLPPTRTQVSVVSDPTLTPGELLGAILLGLGVPEISGDKAERRAMLKELIEKGDREGRTTVVFIDE